MTPSKKPVVLEPLQTPDEACKSSAVIFLHGLGDDGRGTGYGLAQQFQIHKKLPYTKWVLPTAPVDPDVGQRCWYKPHELPSAVRPGESGDQRSADASGMHAVEDEEGILEAVRYIDDLVAEEVKNGLPPERIVVGGFSQGCAVSMIWGLKGRWRDKVAGVFGLSGYFPRIKSLEPSVEHGDEGSGSYARRWFFGHGMSDMLISVSLFAEGQKALLQFVDREVVEGHVYQELGHDVGGGELRDFWVWLRAVLPD